MSLKSEALFEKMAPLLKDHGADLVKKVGASYHFEIKKDKDSEGQWFSLDLKNGNGKSRAMTYQVNIPRVKKEPLMPLSLCWMTTSSL